MNARRAGTWPLVPHPGRADNITKAGASGVLVSPIQETRGRQPALGAFQCRVRVGLVSSPYRYRPFVGAIDAWIHSTIGYRNYGLHVPLAATRYRCMTMNTNSSLVNHRLLELKASGASPIDAIKTIHLEFGLPLQDAKGAFSLSPAWATEVAEGAKLHAEILQVLDGEQNTE